MRTSLKGLIIATITVLSAAAFSANISCAAPQQPKENQAPIIEQISGATSWSPNWEGQFIVSAIDPDGDNLTYTWLADNGTLTAKGNSATWISPGTMGKYNITIIINDGKGHEVRGVKEVSVFINSDGSQTQDPPVVLKMSLPSTDTVTGAKRLRSWFSARVECDVEGMNPQDLKYKWTASNGKIQGKGVNEGTASKVEWLAPGVAGKYTLDVVVSDSKGNQSKGTVNFEVFCCGN